MSYNPELKYLTVLTENDYTKIPEENKILYVTNLEHLMDKYDETHTLAIDNIFDSKTIKTEGMLLKIDFEYYVFGFHSILEDENHNASGVVYKIEPYGVNNYRTFEEQYLIVSYE